MLQSVVIGISLIIALGAGNQWEAYIPLLASLPPSQTLGLVHDVFLFGSPVPADPAPWAAARRVAAGRVVNGYGTNDYVLAVLARVSGANWGVAGLRPVDVAGVEDMACDGVDGHLKWRGMVGHALAQCGEEGGIHVIDHG